MQSPLLLPLLLSAGACASAGRAPDPRLADLQDFRAARERGDLEAARRHLADDPRVWYDEKRGSGAPWRLGGGRWKAWDEHFRGVSEPRGGWHVEKDAIWSDFHEINDYYRLTERGGGWWRGTYFFDADGRIAGFLVSPVPGKPTPRGRRDEFQAWALERHPQEAAYLMPGGSIDPTGDRPPRMRALLEAWRESVGLARID